MIRRILKISACAVLCYIAILCWLLFVPHSYDVPEWQPRSDASYWNLTTGSRIGYLLLPAKGPKKPYPIIFLQGGPGGFFSQKTIEMLAPLTEDGYDVYLYDQIGSGHSARLQHIREYTATRHQRDLEAIVRHIRAKQVILIGQSWGAILATLFVADNPARVAKIIFTGSGPIQPQAPGLSSIVPPDSLGLREPPYSNRQANASSGNLRMSLAARWAMQTGRKLVPDAEADAFQTVRNLLLSKSTVCDTEKAPKQARPGGGYYVQIMTVASFDQTPDPRPRLGAAAMPVLIMKGQCDNQKWGYTAEYLKLFSNHQLVVIPGAGHSIATEQPALYLQTIRAFLNNK